MKKSSEKVLVEKSPLVQRTDDDLTQHDTNLKILRHIDKRREENEALKKLLENLNASLPKPKTKKLSK
jgi:hypothetical protein